LGGALAAGDDLVALLDHVGDGSISP
jgi:hypothetical protein